MAGGDQPVGVEGDPVRMEMSKQMGPHVVFDPKPCDVVAEIKKLTGGGADVAIEALRPTAAAHAQVQSRPNSGSI